MAPRRSLLAYCMAVFSLIETIQTARGPDRGPNFFTPPIKFEQISKGPSPDRGPNYGRIVNPSSNPGTQQGPGSGRLRPQVIFPSGSIESAPSLTGKGPPPFGPPNYKPHRDLIPPFPPGAGPPTTFPPGSRPSNVSPTPLPRPPFMSPNFQAPYSKRPRPPVKDQFHPSSPGVKHFLRPPPLRSNMPPAHESPEGPSKFHKGEKHAGDLSQNVNDKQPDESRPSENEDVSPKKKESQGPPQGQSTNVQPVYGPPPQGGRGGPWSAGGNADETYFEYVKQPAKGEYEFGFERGNPSHSVSRHEKGKNWRFRSQVSWKDKYAGSGLQVWEYNHVDKNKGKGGGGKPWAGGPPGPWAGGNGGPWAGGNGGPWAGGGPGPWPGAGSGLWNGGGVSNPWSDAGGPSPWPGGLGDSDPWNGGGAGLETWPGGAGGAGIPGPWSGGAGGGGGWPGPWSGGETGSNPWAGGGDSPWAEAGEGLGPWAGGSSGGNPWANGGGGNPWANGGGGGGGAHSVWLGGSEPVTVGKYGGADTVMGGGYEAGGGTESGHGGYDSNGGVGWDVNGGGGGNIAGGPWKSDSSAGSYGSAGAETHGMTEAIFWKENAGHEGAAAYGDNPHEIDFKSLGNEWLQGDLQGYESKKETKTEKKIMNSTKENPDSHHHQNITSKNTKTETTERRNQNPQNLQEKSNDKTPSNRKLGSTAPERHDRSGDKKEEEIDHSQFLPDASLLFGLTDRYYARAH